jgi:hypothetical protein
LKIIVNLHTQNNSVNKKYKRFTPFLSRASKQIIAKQIKKDEKGTPENYRLVAFKDMSNEDVLSLNLLRNKRNNYS